MTIQRCDEHDAVVLFMYLCHQFSGSSAVQNHHKNMSPIDILTLTLCLLFYAMQLLFAAFALRSFHVAHTLHERIFRPRRLSFLRMSAYSSSGFGALGSSVILADAFTRVYMRAPLYQVFRWKILTDWVLVLLTIFPAFLYALQIVMDLGYNDFLLQKKWTIFLRESYDETNWFAVNRKSFGHWRYNLRFCVVFLALIMTLEFVPSFLLLTTWSKCSTKPSFSDSRQALKRPTLRNAKIVQDLRSTALFRWEQWSTQPLHAEFLSAKVSDTPKPPCVGSSNGSLHHIKGVPLIGKTG